jgi:hypothetical protein
MTSYSSIRSALATLLATVTHVGAVHNRERFVVDPSKYLDEFKVTIGGVAQIRGWMILRETAVPVYDTAYGEQRRRHGFVLYGVLGFADATDTYGTMQTLCDDVMALVDNQTTLSIPGVLVRAIGPCSLRSFRTEQFGSVLCHAAEIDVPVETMLPLGTA